MAFRMIWHAVMTKPRKEGLANDLLQYQGYETLYLHYPDTVKHARRTRKVLKPYFPRYVFAGMSNGLTVHGINRTIGVSTVVYLGDDPLEIPGPVMEELQRRGDQRGMVHVWPKETAERRKRFRKGAEVRITGGPLEGLFAIVSLDKGHQVSVWVQMFGGKVEAQMEPTVLRGVSPERGFIQNSSRRRA